MANDQGFVVGLIVRFNAEREREREREITEKSME